MAGPEVRDMADLVRQVLRADGSRRLVVRGRVPGAAGRAMAAGALLDPHPSRSGRQTFAEWLSERAPLTS
jgi:hypothetical protein